MTFCIHNWSFPRRRARFGDARNVDVQTWVECGTQRLSPIQFAGSSLANEPLHASVKTNFAEGEVNA